MDKRVDYIKEIRELVGNKKIIINFVGACIKDDNGAILLQRRADKNQWGFPGGAVEVGESLQEALVREIKEETGLTIKMKRLLGVYSKYEDTYPNGDIAQPITHLFEGEIISGTLNISDNETLELRFFNLVEFPPLVNQQHEDFKKDLLEMTNEQPVIR